LQPPTSRRASQHRELILGRGVLERQVAPRAQQTADCPQEDAEVHKHGQPPAGHESTTART
jgi:hypothetical protein